ncbi:MAG: hypothetical protein A2887_03600 [Alphaproteobacteria bacterium RIFCSPLOWO2_01_FULL_40_26]|nr:MAG: hypothetical protein A3D15_04755 [Alphaproteobacteria bacterium RIFCSPHIGHO2_02_FULL_40_34]OFW88970.1 MAG: hypothetical protein A2794_02135 [Alphaproteobacteria bacterium RIFCSPHIGHO2_01_FULL_40_8]OFW95284.1 MAG: hypothetical protein A2887_03600 [Alphaproteobacteria bacterium RIFCSPLOWO2_01_FULL_40_26]OFX09187.1 MAG: hypothetical protein A3H30_06305 [Alphaproteobacteria bacterium RIFCSPLOWO2_02_FULL_40_19]OFX11543.1 MAG: hypothetical protein A3G22_04910 [Alphaproteobacteria bacterium RI
MKKMKIFRKMTKSSRTCFGIWKKLLSIFFPSHCLSCEEIVSKDALFCSECWQKLQFISEPKCKICSYPFEVEIKHLPPFCSQCLLKKPSYDRSVVIFRYNHIIRTAISALKYRDQTFLAKKFSTLLVSKSKNEIDACDLITAVPLHPKKLRKRKFNQAAMIAKKLSPEKFITDLLWRTADTTPQVQLRKKQREKNLKRAFVMNKKYRNNVKNKKILLVDDVMTTGATLENCAKELKRRGAKEVVVLTIAKTVF